MDEVRQRNLITGGLLLGMFLSALEMTVVATAMPRIIDDLGGKHLYGLPFALFLLLATVSGPLWGYASDMHGRRPLYLGSIVIFVLGSMICGAAQTMSWLVMARAVQGLGAGGLQTLTFTIIGELFPLEKRSKVQGYISAVWGLSALTGPLIGGLIVDHVSWRWVFYLNLPFGLAGAVLVGRYYVDRARKTGQKLDLAGAGLFTLGSSLLFYGLQTHRPLLGGLGMGALVFFPWLESRQDAPLVPFKAFQHPLLARAVLSNLLGGMAFFGLTAYLPLFAQTARGMTATGAGALLSPTTVGWTMASIVAARLLPKTGPRPLSRAGAAGMIAGFSVWTVALMAPIWILGAAGLVAGFGMGTTMLSLFVSSQEEAPREILGSVTATLLFARNIGGAVGSALMGALLGDALEVGGAALGSSFWRVTVLAVLLSVGVLALVARLPDIKNRQPGRGLEGVEPG